MNIIHHFISNLLSFSE